MRSNRSSKTAVAGLAAALCAMLFMAWLSAEVVNGGTAQFDDWTRGTIHGYASPVLTAIMREFTFLGSPPMVWPLAGLTVFLLYRAGWPKDAATFGVCMLGAFAMETGLKHLFRRARPEPFFGLAVPESYSYPSGHAVLSMCFCSMLAWLLARRAGNLRSRILIWSAAAVLTILIGLSRIYLGVHYPSDVIGGYGAGIAWAAIVIVFYEIRRGRV